MNLTPFAISKFLSEVSENALSSILVTLAGTAISVILLQLEKQYAGILVIPFSSETLDNFEHELNCLTPFNFTLPERARFSIVLLL